MHLKHGAVLQGGKYRIVKVLGAGSFGVTYLAKTKVTGNFGAIETSVAIKEFFSSELNTRLADGSVREMSGNSLASKYLKKFAEEADKISLLKEHPGIVKVLETFSENNTCYYVMEYKDGGSLREYVDVNGGVPESEAIEMIRKIGDSLSYMHSRKMLHLDLKPGNVMMDSDGSLCLIDFGLSRHFENEESESTTGIGLGTVGYAPIEQAGYNSSDVRKDIPVTIDIYALGATFYKILTGKTPPPSYELLQSFPSAALEAKGISAKTIEAIKKAMSPIPSFRPQTVAEFLLMLDKDYKPSVPSVAEEEKTEIFLDPEPSQEPETINEDSCEGDQTQVQHNEEKPQKKPRRWLWWLLAAVMHAVARVVALMSSKSGGEAAEHRVREHVLEKAKLEAKNSKAEQERKQYEADRKDYNSKISEADGKSRSDEKSLKEAKQLYEEAAKYETNYKGTEYASFFVKGAASPSPKTSGSSSTASKTGTHKGHEWVDLGLSVKWATRNVGASAPADYGNYYAWGETRPKSEYTEYNSVSLGKSWGDIGGNSSRDAARANWGGSWRMPTKAELQELIDNCTWTWTTQNGKKGYRVTGKNSQSIFLPAVGYRYGGTLYDDGDSGYYWSSTPYESGTVYAYLLCFGEGLRGVDWYRRGGGRSVRPVLEDLKLTESVH